LSSSQEIYGVLTQLTLPLERATPNTAFVFFFQEGVSLFTSIMASPEDIRKARIRRLREASLSPAAPVLPDAPISRRSPRQETIDETSSNGVPSTPVVAPEKLPADEQVLETPAQFTTPASSMQASYVSYDSSVEEEKKEDNAKLIATPSKSGDKDLTQTTETPLSEAPLDQAKGRDTEKVKSNLAAKFGDEDDDESESPFKKYKKVFCCFLILSLLSILAVIVVYLVRFNDENETSEVIINNNGGGTTGGGTTGTIGGGDNSGTPNSTPVSIPTASPTRALASPVIDFLKNDYDVDVLESEAASNAVEWLIDEASLENESIELTPKLVQRFALLSLDFALFSSNESPNGDEIVVDGEDDEGTPNGSFFSSTRNNVFAQEVMPNWGMRNQDECFWKGVICNVLDEVTEIRLADKGITGSIATEVGLLSSLLHLDISNNKVTGTIPEEIYDISGLKQIFLYHNKLEGTISTNIGNLRSITHYHVSNNQLTGKIPETMKSNEDGIFPIRK
jgi:hypothetical protein